MSASLVIVLFLVIHKASAADNSQFVHQGFAGAPGLALDGLAVVTPDGLLGLTNATDRMKAHAFHPVLHFSASNPHRRRDPSRRASSSPSSPRTTG
jgi:hypothetical protein